MKRISRLATVLLGVSSILMTSPATQAETRIKKTITYFDIGGRTASEIDAELAKTIDAMDPHGQPAWVLLAGEAVAAVLAVAPGTDGDRLTYFGVASLAIQWISLSSHNY